MTNRGCGIASGHLFQGMHVFRQVGLHLALLASRHMTASNKLQGKRLL
jgi:hypothetical protein